QLARLSLHQTKNILCSNGDSPWSAPSPKHLGLCLPGPFEGTTSTECLRELLARNVRCTCEPTQPCTLPGREGCVARQGSRLIHPEALRTFPSSIDEETKIRHLRHTRPRWPVGRRA